MRRRHAGRDRGKRDEHCTASATTITITAPDLVVSALTEPPAFIAIGGQIIVTALVTNQGDFAATGSETQFFLSDNGVNKTKLLGLQGVPGIAVGDTRSGGASTLAIPSTPGTWHLMACADARSRVAERDETNNCRASTQLMVVGGVDLGDNIAGNPPAETDIGVAFAISDTVTGYGHVASKGSVAYFLSTDRVKSADDRKLTGARAVPLLATGQHHSGTVNVKAPTGTPGGTYFVLACVTAASDYDKTNNCAASAAPTVLGHADLVVTAVVPTTPVPIVPTTIVTVAVTIANTGTATATSTMTSMYLSTDATPSADDIFLGQYSVPAIAAGASDNRSGSAEVFDPVPGTFFAIVCADGDRVIGELSETNNCTAAPVTLVDLCAAVTCDAPDACHAASSCDPATGTCLAFPAVADGTSCADADRCDGDEVCEAGACVTGPPANGGCDPLTTCTSTFGTRTCGPCPAGYTGDGEVGCTDVDECATANGGCDALATCTNTDGGFACACPAGLLGDGTRCEPAASFEKSIASFAFFAANNPGLAHDVHATIRGGEIRASVPAGTSPAGLVATFASSGASVRVGGVVQTTGQTANDFTTPVVYEVTAADGTSQRFVVAVTSPYPLGLRPRVDLPIGSQPAEVAAGDLDGDDRPDLVVANSGSPFVTIYPNRTARGAATAEFGDRIDLPSPVSCFAVRIADMTGDGRGDLVVACHNSISIYRNVTAPGDPAPSFAEPAVFPASTTQLQIAVGDVNGDGRLDVVTPDFFTGVAVFVNTTTDPAAPTLAPGVVITSTPRLYSIALADLDGDGKLDVIAGTERDGVVFALNRTRDHGVPAFETSGSVPAALTLSLATADLDRDGKDDVVAGTTNATLLYANRTVSGGPASFVPIGTFPGQTWGVATGDIDGNAIQDFASGSFQSNVTALFQNTTVHAGEVPAFTTRDLTSNYYPEYATFADLDGDGRQDLVASYLFFNGNSVGALGVFLAEPACDGDAAACGPSCDTPVQLDVGGDHACDRLGDGTARCWGTNVFGQLGVGSRQSSTTPVAVPLVGVAQIASGTLHTCALLDDGTVRCWGMNEHGEVGSGSVTPFETSPVGVAGLAGVTQIATGDAHSCALLADRTVRCWGLNMFGQLGDGTQIDRAAPVVAPFANVVQLAVGRQTTCALIDDGTVQCVGYGEDGQLGDGNATTSLVPVEVAGLSGVVQISSTFFHTCAVVVEGTVRCWGQGTSGQLGDGGGAHRLVPVAAADIASAVAVAAGQFHTCAALVDGTARCWGANGRGQLGNGTFSSSTTPVAVAALTGVVEIAAGGSATCARTIDSELRCWGDNQVGMLGNGTTVDAPTAIPAIHATCVRTGSTLVTSITSATPADPATSSTTMTFTFEANDAAATFECSLDGQPRAPCQSPFTVGDLAGGAHRFVVYSAVDDLRDNAGDAYDWTVDTTTACGPVASAAWHDTAEAFAANAQPLTVFDFDHRADGSVPVAGTEVPVDEYLACCGIRVWLETENPTAELIWAGNPQAGFGLRAWCPTHGPCSSPLTIHVELAFPVDALGARYPGSTQIAVFDPGDNLVSTEARDGSGFNVLGYTSTVPLQHATFSRTFINEISNLQYTICS